MRLATHFLRATPGQVLPLAVVLLLAMLPLAFGVMGAGAAYIARDQVQTAADAAALAAAGQEALWESVTVSWHEFTCSAPTLAAAGGTPVCRDGPSVTSNLPRAFAATLFGAAPGGLPGWARTAGCDTVGADPAVPPPGGASVCDGWRLQPGGFGVSYGLGFPPGADPGSAASAYLHANTAALRADGVHVALLALRTQAATGEVDLTVRVIEPGNPLGLLTGHATTITVQAGAHRRVPSPPLSGV